jgi:hypothetical protein
MAADTNHRPCGVCSDSCGWTTDSNGNHQCAVFGRLWTDDSPTGPAFIARLLGMSDRATVDQWRRRGIFPPPDWPEFETGRPLWRRRTVLDWAKETGRL